MTHDEVFPDDWPFPASEGFKLRYTTNMDYRNAAKRMRALFEAGASASKVRDNPDPLFSEFKYMADWFYQRNAPGKGFSRAPDLPADAFNAWPVIFWHVGPRPSKKYSLHRLDDTRSYVWDNLDWATRKTQAIERRDKRRIKFAGRHLTNGQFVEELRKLGVKYSDEALRQHRHRHRENFKTEQEYQAFLFKSLGVEEAAHLNPQDPLITSGFIVGYQTTAWWEERKAKHGPGLTRLKFQEKEFRRLIVETQHRMKQWKPSDEQFKTLEQHEEKLQRYFKRFREELDRIKKQSDEQFLADLNPAPATSPHIPPGFLSSLCN